MLAKRRWRKRMRTHGFRARMRTATGKRVIMTRRKKGRKSLSVTGKLKPWTSFSVKKVKVKKKKKVAPKAAAPVAAKAA